MNQIYPKRIINFIAVCLFITCLMVIGRQVTHLNSNFSNLTSIDKTISILIVAFMGFASLSCLASFKRKSWAWIGISSYLIYSIGSFCYDSYKFGIDQPLIIVLPLLILLLGLLIFMFSSAVTVYFTIHRPHTITALILPVLVYAIGSLDPIKDTQKVNAYYVDLIEDQLYFRDSIFSGQMYTNHSNGNIKFEGAIENGVEEGKWKYFYSDGKLQNSIAYRNGSPDGKVISYFPTGEIKEERSFEDGNLHGKYQLWGFPEEINITGSYTKGQKHGVWKEYEMDSKMVKVESYNFDTLANIEYIEEESSK